MVELLNAADTWLLTSGLTTLTWTLRSGHCDALLAVIRARRQQNGELVELALLRHFWCTRPAAGREKVEGEKGDAPDA